MRTLRLSIVLVVAAMLGGCFQSTALIRVSGDGSGTLEHRTSMRTTALARVWQMAGAFATGREPFDPFSEDQARALAANMGECGTLTSSTPLTTGAAEARVNIYAFDDIAKLQFNATSVGPGNMSMRSGGVRVAGGAPDAATFDLARNPAGNAVLTLHLPGFPLDSLMQRTRANDRSIPTGQLALLRQTLTGLRMVLMVELNAGTHEQPVR